MNNTVFSRFNMVFEHIGFPGSGACFRCAIVCISILFANAIGLYGQTQLEVGLRSLSKTQKLIISPNRGSYVITDAGLDTVYIFKSDDAISVERHDDRMKVKSIYGFEDTLEVVHLKGSGTKQSLKLKADKDDDHRAYSNNLRMEVRGNELHVVNVVDVENYVSRVIQSEVGYGAAPAYYKIQSIICRTYAYRNLPRHADDGFHLCDNEHCQVYDGTKTISDEIFKATAATNGLVMVNDENRLILSAFHANCGGQTANSKDIWKEQRSYLTSVVDTFCLNSRSAKWEKTISIKEFVDRLGFEQQVDSLRDFQFDSNSRETVFRMGPDSIPMSRTRSLLQLRSTFFSVHANGDDFILTGRGYGHGVGLCQQGAMQMALHGYNYSQILGYYYKGVSLVHYNSLPVSE